MPKRRERYVYILHIEYPDGSLAHYVGSAKRDRISERLKEQKNRHAARLTRDAQRNGAVFMLGAILQGGTYQWEEAVARSYIQPSLCICCKQREPTCVEAREMWSRETETKAALERAARLKPTLALSLSSPRADARPAPRASGIDSESLATRGTPATSTIGQG